MASATSASPAVPKGLVRVLGALSARLPAILFAATLIAAWQLLLVAGDVSPLLIPTPVAVFREVVAVWSDGLVIPALSSTLYALSIGLALGIVGGTLLGLAIGISPRTEVVSRPYLWGLFSAPDVAFVPLLIVWFGFGDTTKILMVILGVSIPMTMSVRDGVRTLDDSMLRAAVSFCAERNQIAAKVILPGILPAMAAGIRNGISRGFAGVLVVEMTVSSTGLGGEVIRASRMFNAARVFAFIAILVALAVLLIQFSKVLEHYVSGRWRDEVSL